MLGKIGSTVIRKTSVGPWGLPFGIARSLLGLGTLLTLLFSKREQIFIPVLDGGPNVTCVGAQKIGLYCLTDGNSTVVMIISIAVLIWVVSGLLPALSAIPHAWIAFSIANSITVPEGGDQIAQILALLILPAALTDRRLWHWTTPSKERTSKVKLLAWSCIWIIWLQGAVIYIHAAFAKFAVTEWVEGTALYYWVNSPSFGASGWRLEALNWVFSYGLLAAAVAWSAIAIEIALGLSILYPQRIKNIMFVIGIGLHLSIAVVMGLISFFFPMAALLVLYLLDLRPQTGGKNELTQPDLDGWNRTAVQGEDTPPQKDLVPTN